MATRIPSKPALQPRPDAQTVQGSPSIAPLDPATEQSSSKHLGAQFEVQSQAQQPVRLTPQPVVQSRPNPQMLAFQGTELQPTSRPEVQAMWEQYGQQQPLQRPQERILRWGAELHKMLETDGAKDLDGVIDQVVQRDARRMVFFLQGALKIYRKRYPELEGHYRNAKQLEDTLGQYSRFNSMATKSQELGLPDAVTQHFVHHRDETRAQIGELLQQKWLPDFHDGKAPALDSLLQEMAGLEWDSPQDDRAFVEKFFQKRIGKLEKKDFDMEQLQGDDGLHEFRRQLRWISIYAISLDGMVTLDGADFDAIHQASNSAVEYPSGPDFESDPLSMPLELFERNQSLVEAFGQLKDRGEIAEDLIHAYAEVGLGTQAEAEAHIQGLLGPEYAHQHLLQESQDLYQRVEAGHLQQLKDALG